MTPREAVDIYKKIVREESAIDCLYQTKNFFAFFTERDRSGCRSASHYVDKNTGKLIDGFEPSPETTQAMNELDDELWKDDQIPKSEYS